jgi:hypothetical protein
MTAQANSRRHLGRGLGTIVLGLAAVITMTGAMTGLAAGQSMLWKMSWPKTDFSKRSVDFDEIMSGGPPKDGIPSINDPKFVPLARIEGMAGTEPVISLKIGGAAKAYPLAFSYGTRSSTIPLAACRSR